MKKYRYKKSYRSKKRKSIIRLILYSRFFWLSCLVLTILGVIFYFVIFSSFFQIKQVIISGNDKVSKEKIKVIVESELEKKILFFSSESIFLVNLNKIKGDILSSFSQIAEVEISRGLPNSLNIIVIERLALANFCQAQPSSVEQNLETQNENCFLLDNEGIVFEKTQLRDDLVKITDKQMIDLILGKKVIEKEQLNQILKIESKLKNDLKIPLREISIISEERLDVKTSEGWEIYFNPKKDIDWQLRELGFLLKEKIPPDKRRNLEYVDLRFGKIYIFPETYNQ